MHRPSPSLDPACPIGQHHHSTHIFAVLLSPFLTHAGGKSATGAAQAAAGAGLGRGVGGQLSALVRGRETVNGRLFHIAPGLAAGKVPWNASDNSFLLSLRGKWDVRSFSLMPGVFLLQQPDDFACVLLIQDACYVYMTGPSRLHIPLTGMWYSDEGVRDFKRISTSNDLCSLFPDSIADHQDRSWRQLSALEAAAALNREATVGRNSGRVRGVEEEEEEDGRKGGAGGGRKGSGVGKERMGGRVERAEEEEGDWRGGGGVGYSADRADEEGEEGEERAGHAGKRRRLLATAEHKTAKPHKSTSSHPKTTSPAAQSQSPPATQEQSPPPARVSGFENQAPGFTDEFDEELHDITDIKRRERRVYGRFESPLAVARYLNLSDASSRARLAQGRPGGRVEKVGYVPKYGSYMGEFGEAVVPLMEGAVHLVRSPPSDPAKDTRGVGRVVFFPGEREVRSKWTADMAHILFGPKAQLLLGQVVGQKVCFRNALFPLNRLHTPQVADTLRQRALLGAGGRGKGKKARQSGVVRVKVLRTSRSLPPVQAAPGSQVPAAPRRMRWQVTVLERERGRSLMNVHEVARVAHSLFPEMPLLIARIGKSSAYDQALLLKNTLVLISLHGTPLTTALFMPRGSVVVELFPYKFLSTLYKKIAMRSGVNYLAWRNIHDISAFFRNSCMKDGGFTHLPEEQCWNIHECVACARDQSITRVDRREFKEVMANARMIVRTLIYNNTA
ncbi:hypothetical protein CLOM_g6577 [Closterium sp. NIES-68]|nr:hypothetical protein CLOM_g6577 [Closterium sp. NIES-68]GJP82225.1 hypothetical protein CLOP_g12461 [Closterium sp. NIES-67]